MTLDAAAVLEVDSVVKVSTKLTGGTKRRLALVKRVDRMSDPMVTVQFQLGNRKLARPADLEFVRFASNAEGRRVLAAFAK
jgi:hypothetical protein